MEKTEENPFFKSKYFDINALLAQLKPLLEKINLTNFRLSPEIYTKALQLARE